MKERLVPAAIIPAIMDLAIKNRLNMKTILQRAQVDLSLEQPSGALLTLEQQLCILDAAYGVMGNPAFGLLLGEAIQYHSLDLVGQLIASSKNVQEALDELFLFKDLITPITTFSLSTRGSLAILSFNLDPALVKQNPRMHAELVASTVVTVGNSIIPAGLRLRRVRFRHSRPDYMDDYQRVFGDCVEFDCDANELQFDSALLLEPLLTAFPDYHAGVRVLATEKLRSLENRESLSARVSYYITRNLGSSVVSLEEVAEHFHMTARTLQRKLKTEGVSFVELRDGCRHARALQDLADPRMDMDHLAELLGFSDTSNFYHAFKRWQGVSPGAYRKQVMSGQGGSD